MAHTRWRSVLDVIETIAIIATCGAVVFTLVTGRAGSGPATVAPRPPQPEDVRERHWSLSLNSASTINPNNAKLALVEFSDFQCPYCGRYARETFPRLRGELVDTGKLEYSFKHFPIAEIHPFATDAAKQAACAGKQSHFWEMHDRLFEGQTQLSDQFLALGASRLGLNMNAFAACLNAASDEVANDQADGRRLGVTSTPTFFLGRIVSAGTISIAFKLTGAHPFETFAAAITHLADDRPKTSVMYR